MAQVKQVALIDANGQVAGTFSGNGGANTEVALTSITAANPAVITAAAHGFIVNNLVKIISSKIAGLDGVYVVTAVTANTFTITFDNSAGGTVIAGKAISLMAFSSSSAVPGSANTQNKAVVAQTFKNLAQWDEFLIELKGSAVVTAALTFDWVIQRSLDPDRVKWDDYFYISQPNNTALDVIVALPVGHQRDNTVAVVSDWTRTDTGASTNAVSVAPTLLSTKAYPGSPGTAMRLVIVPRAANMDGTALLAAQVIIRAVSGD